MGDWQGNLFVFSTNLQQKIFWMAEYFFPELISLSAAYFDFYFKKCPTTTYPLLPKCLTGPFPFIFLETYEELRKWSTEHYGDFWGKFWEFSDIVHSQSYDEVKSDYLKTIFV